LALKSHLARGAWIETSLHWYVQGPQKVAPRAGAWIETK